MSSFCHFFNIQSVIFLRVRSESSGEETGISANVIKMKDLVSSPIYKSDIDSNIDTSGAKMNRKQIFKSSGFVPFGANIGQYYAKSNITATKTEGAG